MYSKLLAEKKTVLEMPGFDSFLIALKCLDGLAFATHLEMDARKLKGESLLNAPKVRPCTV